MDEDTRYCILIVDDEIHNIDMLCEILMPLYRIKTAKDGHAAIKMAEKHNPDLILLDIIMPGMSGFEVLTRLKNSALTMNIPVIFITGLDSSRDEEKGLLMGAVDYIIKPFKDSIVKSRVKTHLKIVGQMRIIERLGMIDSLTDIPNRRSFDHQMSVEWMRALRNKTDIGILMLDIDKFKHFNDTYGHACGDDVLKTVADVITHTLKRPTDFAARWGGEEFAVLLPGSDLSGATEVAELIRRNIEQTVFSCTTGTTAKLTVSIGVNSEIPDIGSSIESFVSESDKALYRAKESGRNAVCSV